MTETIYGPEMNDGKHVLVFGSNRQGKHGKGAALTAKQHWGAVEGCGSGRQGMSYAIPTREFVFGRLETCNLFWIERRVDQFLEHAGKDLRLTFLVTRIGCGLAGYRDEQIAPMFNGAPENCVLPEGWRDQP